MQGTILKCEKFLSYKFSSSFSSLCIWLCQHLWLLEENSCTWHDQFIKWRRTAAARIQTQRSRDRLPRVCCDRFGSVLHSLSETCMSSTVSRTSSNRRKFDAVSSRFHPTSIRSTSAEIIIGSKSCDVSSKGRKCFIFILSLDRDGYHNIPKSNRFVASLVIGFKFSMTVNKAGEKNVFRSQTIPWVILFTIKTAEGREDWNRRLRQHTHKSSISWRGTGMPCGTRRIL